MKKLILGLVVFGIVFLNGCASDQDGLTDPQSGISQDLNELSPVEGENVCTEVACLSSIRVVKNEGTFNTAQNVRVSVIEMLSGNLTQFECENGACELTEGEGSAAYGACGVNCMFLDIKAAVSDEDLRVILSDAEGTILDEELSPLYIDRITGSSDCAQSVCKVFSQTITLNPEL